MFKELNPILHSQLRLAIMSILLTVEEAEFVYLKEKTQSTAGNLSVQLDKLSEAGYIEVEKKLCRQRPRTACRITAGGRKAMEEYVETLKEYLSGVVVHALNKVIGELCLLAFSSTFAPQKQVKRCMMP